MNMIPKHEYSSFSQLAMLYLALSLEVWHMHNLDHQACPPSEMLGALTMPGLRIILLPSKACSLPLVEDIVYQIPPELGVNSSSLLFMWVLGCFRSGDIIQRLDGEIVDVDPDGRAPVVFVSPVMLVLHAQASYAVLTPELFRIGDQIEDWFQAGAVRRKQSSKERED